MKKMLLKMAAIAVMAVMGSQVAQAQAVITDAVQQETQKEALKAQKEAKKPKRHRHRLRRKLKRLRRKLRLASRQPRKSRRN